MKIVVLLKQNFDTKTIMSLDLGGQINHLEVKTCSINNSTNIRIDRMLVLFS